MILTSTTVPFKFTYKARSDVEDLPLPPTHAFTHTQSPTHTHTHTHMHTHTVSHTHTHTHTHAHTHAHTQAPMLIAWNTHYLFLAPMQGTKGAYRQTSTNHL